MKIQGQNQEMLYAACQQFLGKSQEEVRSVALETLVRFPQTENVFPVTLSGLSIGFEVDGDILKVDGYGGRKPPHFGPHTSEGSGGG